ncbi:MAG: hypothetical protein K1X92_04220 [Bacteroidia bacterium]|nr:hypothetical protein [Bacteroidia bacterium]
MKIVKVLGIFLLLTIGLNPLGYAQFPVFDSLLKAGKYNTIGEIRPGGFALTSNSRKGDFYLENGQKIVIQGYEPTQIRRGKYGYFHFEVNQKWGLTNSLFQVVIPPEYDGLAHIVTPEYFVVKNAQSEGLLHISGKFIYPIEYKEITCLRILPANTVKFSFDYDPTPIPPLVWILTDNNNQTWHHAGEKKWKIPIREAEEMDAPRFLQSGQLLLKEPRQNSLLSYGDNQAEFQFNEMFRITSDSIAYLSGAGIWKGGILMVNWQPLDTAGNPLLPYPVLDTDVLSPEYITCVKELEGIPAPPSKDEHKPSDENPIGTIICVKPETEVKPPEWKKVRQLIRVKDRKVLHEIPLLSNNCYYLHQQQLICEHRGVGSHTPDTLYALDEAGKHTRMLLEEYFTLYAQSPLFSMTENKKEILYNFKLKNNGIHYKEINRSGDFLECEKGFYLYKKRTRQSGTQRKPIFSIRIVDFYRDNLKREKRYILLQGKEVYCTSSMKTLTFLGFPLKRIRLHFNGGKKRIVRASKVEETAEGFWVWHEKGKKESVFDMDGNRLVDADRIPENNMWTNNPKPHPYTLSGNHIRRKTDVFVKKDEKWYAKKGNTVIEIPENYDRYWIVDNENAVEPNQKELVIYNFLHTNYIGAVDTFGNEILPPVFHSFHKEGKWWIIKKSEKEYELRDSLFNPVSGGQYEFIQSVWDKQYLIMKKSGKTGLFSMDLKPLIPAEYDGITPEGSGRDGYFLLRKEGKMGLADNYFKLLVPVAFDSVVKISPYTARHFPPENPFVYLGKIPGKDKLAIYNEAGALVSNAEYSGAGGSIREPFLSVKKGRKWKMIHAETGKETYGKRLFWYYSYDENDYGKTVKTMWGRKIVPRTQNLKLEEIGEYLVVQKSNRRFEIMDTTGKVRFSHKGKIDTKLEHVKLFPVEYNGRFALLDFRAFQLGLFDYEELEPLSYYECPAFWAVSEGKGGVLNANTGEWIVEPGPYRMEPEPPNGCGYLCTQIVLSRRDTVSLSEAEATRLWPEKKGNEYVRKWVFDLNSKQSVLSPYRYIGAVRYNLAPVSDGKKVGVMDNLNRLVIPLEWDNVEILDSNFLAAYKDCKWAVYDRLGKEIHPLSFDVLMKEDEFPVFYFEFNKNSGYLNGKGENLFGVSLDSVIKGENIELFKDNKTGLGNYKGEILLPVIYDKIGPGRYKVDFVLTLNGKKGIWNHEKGELLPCVYDDIRLDGSDYILTLFGKQGVYFPVNGVLISPEYNAVSSESRAFISSEKFYLLKKEEGTRIADEAGKVIFLHTFSEVDFFPKENRISVVLGGKRYNGIKVVDKWRLFEVKTGG